MDEPSGVTQEEGHSLFFWGETTQQGAPRSFSVSGGSKRASTNQLRSFQLDKKEYPVVSQNDLGAPCCVVSPFFFPLHYIIASASSNLLILLVETVTQFCVYQYY